MTENLDAERPVSPSKSKRPHLLVEETPVDSDLTRENEMIYKDPVDKENILAEQVFSNPLILKEILLYLETNDLIRTSLVNKLFYLFSRELLLEVPWYAHIRDQNPCQDFKNLNALLANSSQIPYNGLDISVDTDKNHQCPSYNNLSEFTSEILATTKIEFLSLDCEEKSSCISLEIIKEIMRVSAISLRQIFVQNSPKVAQTFAEYLKQNVGEHWLPNLESISFSENFFDDDESRNVVKEFVQAAPKLENLKGKFNAECLKFLLPLKLTDPLEEFVYSPTIQSLQDAIAFAELSPELVVFTFSTTVSLQTSIYELGDDVAKKVANILKQILTSSQDSLEELVTEQLDLIKITDQLSIPALEELEHLSLIYCSEIDDEEGYPTLPRINWTKHFPNLKRLTITNEIYNFIERGLYINDHFRANKSAQFTCPSVTKLCFEQSDDVLDVDQIHMFKMVFPNVKEFYLEHDRQFVALLNRLWTAWEELEGIHLCLDMKPSSSNYDSIFMGISYQESSYLLQEYKDLTTLEIVPTKPCLLNLRNLKKLVIEIKHKDRECKGGLGRLASESVFMSRVTGDLVFKRMPDLSVAIARDLCNANESCHLALQHLKPYAQFDTPWDFYMSFD